MNRGVWKKNLVIQLQIIKLIEFITYKLLHLFISNHNEEKLIRILKTSKYFDVTKKIVVLDIGCYIGDWTKNFIYQLNLL